MLSSTSFHYRAQFLAFGSGGRGEKQERRDARGSSLSSDEPFLDACIEREKRGKEKGGSRWASCFRPNVMAVKSGAKRREKKEEKKGSSKRFGQLVMFSGCQPGTSIPRGREKKKRGGREERSGYGAFPLPTSARGRLDRRFWGKGKEREGREERRGGETRDRE